MQKNQNAQKKIVIVSTTIKPLKKKSFRSSYTVAIPVSHRVTESVLYKMNYERMTSASFPICDSLISTYFYGMISLAALCYQFSFLYLSHFGYFLSQLSLLFQLSMGTFEVVGCSGQGWMDGEKR